MAVHLTPTELADEMQMKRRDVLTKCVEMNVPVLKGRIDKTLFVHSVTAAGHRLPAEQAQVLLAASP